MSDTATTSGNESALSPSLSQVRLRGPLSVILSKDMPVKSAALRRIEEMSPSSSSFSAKTIITASFLDPGLHEGRGVLEDGTFQVV